MDLAVLSVTDFTDGILVMFDSVKAVLHRYVVVARITLSRAHHLWNISKCTNALHWFKTGSNKYLMYQVHG